VWDDWNAGDEDPRARERVEMSFESVRLEQEVTVPVSKVDALGITSPLVGTPTVGGTRSFSGGSAVTVGVGSPGPNEMGWRSPASVLKGGFKWS
jgi:hypothetical protein